MERLSSQRERILFCRAVANLMAADGHIAEEERLELRAKLRRLGLDPNDPAVQSPVELELVLPTSLENILAGIKHPALQQSLLQTLIEVMHADGVVHDQELERVRAAARYFGLEVELTD